MPGLTIDQWGPAAWNTLHVVAHTYPKRPTEAQRQETHRFLLLFATHLPCPACRRHFTALLEARLDERALASRERLVAFLNDAHNEVNRRLGKRVFTIEEHHRVYRHSKRTGIDPVMTFAALVVVALAVVASWRNSLPHLRRRVGP